MKIKLPSGTGATPLFVLRYMKKYRAPVSMLLVFSLMHLTLSCHYYKVDSVREDSAQFAKINEAINNKKYFIVSNSSQRLYATNLVLSNDSLKMTLEDIPPTVNLAYETVNQENQRYKAYKAESNILNEVRLILNDGVAIKKGAYSVPLTAINRVDVLDRNSGRTTASYILGTVGVVAGAMVILGVIVALTKSSCPFVYTHDGEGYTLAGETFGGAIFAPVERDDYLALPGFTPVDGSYRLKIQNELKERQYINLAQLVMVQHSTNSTALMDRTGNIYTVSAPQAPLSAVTEEKIDYTKQMQARDSHLFLFNEGDKEKLKSGLFLTFSKSKADKEGKLVLNLKNSLWLDYIYGEFTKLFGSYYNSWAEKQKSEPKVKLNQWFFDQELPLKVYVKKKNAWEFVDYVDLIGPLAAARDVVVPLKQLSAIEGDKVEIKIESGFMFWELDYVGLDLTPNEAVLVQNASGSAAFTDKGEDVSGLLAGTDEKYLQQLQVGDQVELSFKAPEPGDKKVSFFLHTRGYYEHIRDYEGMPDLLELISFRKPGKFTSFSKEKYLELAGGMASPKKPKKEVAYAH
ncbi:hypothetical protein ACFS7Z_14370 [Pontibacter toksunensis]|uniref:Uncharacterized protein n=1 Tax=Pontibacter toksunensis TaxID=1332631 RepID=A0ABW6BX95_9BACT